MGKHQYQPTLVHFQEVIHTVTIIEHRDTATHGFFIIQGSFCLKTLRIHVSVFQFIAGKTIYSEFMFGIVKIGVSPCSPQS